MTTSRLTSKALITLKLNRTRRGDVDPGLGPRVGGWYVVTGCGGCGFQGRAVVSARAETGGRDRYRIERGNSEHPVWCNWLLN